jgi:hypothetical protein
MRSTDATVQAVFDGSFTLTATVDAWLDGEPLAEDLPIVDGTVTWDWDTDVQASLSLTVADPAGILAPTLPGDPLAVFGQELHLSMQASGPGSEDTPSIGVGWFRIQTSVADEQWQRTRSGGWRRGGGTVEVAALDRMQILADYTFLAPSQPPTSATIISEIRRLVDGRVPIADVDQTLTDSTVPAGTIYQDDRVAAIQELARTIGGTLVVDSDGSLRLRQPTQFGAAPVWTFEAGARGGLLSVKTSMTRDGVINAVIATGETDTDKAPVQGIAYDLDPSSPTRWDGPFGPVPLHYSSPLLTTPGQAGQAAKTRLNNYRRGREREFTVSTVPNFLLELDDPVRVILPDRVVDGRVVSITLPLKPGPMSVTVRALDSAITTVEV